jgi:hypothetical protein
MYGIVRRSCTLVVIGVFSVDNDQPDVVGSWKCPLSSFGCPPRHSRRGERIRYSLLGHRQFQLPISNFERTPRN